MKKIILLIITPVLLTACSTSVISDEDRRLPASVTANSDSIVKNANSEESYLSFTGKKGSLVSHEGAFEKFNFTLMYDEADPDDKTKAKVNLAIDIKSMITDNQGLTNHLLSDDFFAADTYPEAAFSSNKITQSGSGYTVTGDLTIKGITKTVTFDAVITDAYLTMVYNLDRTEFGVGPAPEGLQAIDAIVLVDAKIVFE